MYKHSAGSESFNVGSSDVTLDIVLATILVLYRFKPSNNCCFYDIDRSCVVPIRKHCVFDDLLKCTSIV
jgi:hypothetical protein